MNNSAKLPPKGYIARGQLSIFSTDASGFSGPWRSGWCPLLKIDDSKYFDVGRFDFVDAGKTLLPGETIDTFIRLSGNGDTLKFLIAGGIGKIFDGQVELGSCVVHEVLGTLPDLEIGDSHVTNRERLLIEKALDGNLPFLSVLKSQLGHLTALTRNLAYSTQYDYDGQKEGLLMDRYANIAIEDTVFTIEESSKVCRANLTILHGHIWCLDIGGPSELRNGFTIKDIFWQRELPGPKLNFGLGERPVLGRDYAYVKDASERDFESAVGYIPTYR